MLIIIICVVVESSILIDNLVFRNIMSHISTMETSKLKQLLQPIKGVILDIDGTLTVPGT